jgi:hypothetical protein
MFPNSRKRLLPTADFGASLTQATLLIANYLGLKYETVTAAHVPYGMQ